LVGNRRKSTYNTKTRFAFDNGTDLGPERFSAFIDVENKHQAVSQGVWCFGKRSIFIICEQLQKPHNVGLRREARFFNTLLSQKGP
jgi:hypothetical protein